MRINPYKISAHLVLLIYTLFTLIPLLYILAFSIKGPVESATNPGFLVQNPVPENYISVWAEFPQRQGIPPLWNFMRNSLIVVGPSVLLILFLSSLGAYSFSRYHYRGKEALFFSVIAGLMVPPIATVIPVFILNKAYGLFNTYLAVIGPYTALNLPIGVLIIKAYLESLPTEIEEAARLDGASEFRIFYKIVMPLARPALATVAIFSFLNVWNEFLFAVVFLQDTEIQTLPLAVQAYSRNMQIADWGKIFAVLNIMSLPVIIVFLVLQKQFIKGLTGGAVKG